MLILTGMRDWPAHHSTIAAVVHTCCVYQPSFIQLAGQRLSRTGEGYLLRQSEQQTQTPWYIYCYDTVATHQRCTRVARAGSKIF